MNEYTSLDLKTRRYRKEQYACHLGIGRKRIDAKGQLRDPAHVTNVMTRWLQRCVRGQPVVIGKARVTACQDLMTEWWALRAVAYAFRDVHTDDRDLLMRWVDDKRHDAVEIPILAPLPLHR